MALWPAAAIAPPVRRYTRDGKYPGCPIHADTIHLLVSLPPIRRSRVYPVPRRASSARQHAIVQNVAVVSFTPCSHEIPSRHFIDTGHSLRWAPAAISHRSSPDRPRQPPPPRLPLDPYPLDRMLHTGQTARGYHLTGVRSGEQAGDIQLAGKLRRSWHEHPQVHQRRNQGDRGGGCSRRPGPAT